MKKEEINEELLALFCGSFLVILLTAGTTLFALGAYAKYLEAEYHTCAALLSGTFMFTIANKWWLNLLINGIKNLRKHDLTSKQRISLNLCSFIVMLVVCVPFAFINNQEQLFIPIGIVLTIATLQCLTFVLGKVFELKKVKYYTKLEFCFLSLMSLFFVTLAIAEYYIAQQFPGPVFLAYFVFGLYVVSTIVILCLLVKCLTKICKQVTELPEELRPHCA